MESINTENGEYRVLYDSGGTLLPEAKKLFLEAAAFGADCIYADEAYETESGLFPIRKPEYAPDTLLSYNCVGQPLAVKGTLFHALGGCSAQSPEALYQFALRALSASSYVYHIPEVLYIGKKPPQPLPDTREIRQAIAKASDGALVLPGLYRGSFYARYGLKGTPHVSVICVCGAHPDALRRTLESVACDASSTACTLIVPFAGIPNGRAKTYLDALEKNGAARVVYGRSDDNRAVLMNLGAEASHGDILIFMEAGVTLDAHDALDRLITHAQRSGVGAAGGKVITEDGRLVHGGLTFGAGVAPVSLFAGQPDAVGGWLRDRMTNTLADVSGVERVLAIRTETFQAVRGFDETFTAVGAEAELCLRLMRARRRIVYDPLARFRLPEMPERKEIPEANRQRLVDVFRVFCIDGDPMAGRGAWRQNDEMLQSNRPNLTEKRSN